MREIRTHGLKRGLPHRKHRGGRPYSTIFETFGVADEGGSELSAARGYGINDFEDALVAAAAVSAGCDCIITRNIKDFAESPVRAISPTDFLEEKKRCGEMTAVNLAPSLQSSAMKRRFNNE